MTRSISFSAAEYQSDGTNRHTQFLFRGDREKGWKVLRQGKEILALGPGFVPIATRFCGVCSTDLARRFLPYPLPQVIGHEVVGEYEGKPVVVEINASHLALGVDHRDCPFCSQEMDSQCPERTTLGIDRLPGGFAPYILAPQKAICPIPQGINPLVAALTEPLAATLQGVEATFPQNGDKVAVLGPRRLGMLMLAALAGFRKRHGLEFTITALARHKNLLEPAARLGADRVINLLEQDPGTYDIVFDTTGSVSGFELALRCAKRVVHLKSTHGREVMNMDHLSDMVVDELALLPYSPRALNYSWPIEQKPRANPNVLVMPGIDRDDLPAGKNYHQMTVEQAAKAMGNMALPGSPVPRFDLAIVSNLEEADKVIRPAKNWSHGLIRPRGAILVMTSEWSENPLDVAMSMGVEIHTSRCGNFRRALQILVENPELATVLEQEMITHRFPLQEIDQAFATAAASRKSIKVVVETGQ